LARIGSLDEAKREVREIEGFMEHLRDLSYSGEIGESMARLLDEIIHTEDDSED
jgi:hypothetical protein